MKEGSRVECGVAGAMWCVHFCGWGMQGYSLRPGDIRGQALSTVRFLFCGQCMKRGSSAQFISCRLVLTLVWEDGHTPFLVRTAREDSN